jgi:hypothetical protein
VLAYFFYHWKRPEIDAADYERRVHDFHVALAAAPPEGFSTSWSVALSGVAWANHSGPSYEDWYIVRNSADLDALNEAAITASRKNPHDRAASGTEGGSAGLYRVRLGQMIHAPRFTAWFSKPEGLSYAELYERLGPTIAGGGALWQRQMALGPGEFCLHTDHEAVFPTGVGAHAIAARSVFPRGA